MRHLIQIRRDEFGRLRAQSASQMEATLMTIPEVVMNAKVLLVDDEPQQLALRTYILTTCGFSVIAAGGPIEAISIMKMEQFDVAVLDYHMPVMNGCKLADQLRSICPELKIILHSGDINIPRGEMTSVDNFFSKGDGIGPLIARVVELAQAATELPCSPGITCFSECAAA